MTKKKCLQDLQKYLNSSRRANITKHSVLYWWKICNRAFFNNELVQPKCITIKKFRDKYGYCVKRGINQHNVEIAIASWITNRKEFISTLVHEMVHQWQYYHYGTASHGKTFKQWQPVIEKYNIPLDVEGPADE